MMGLENRRSRSTKTPNVEFTVAESRDGGTETIALSGDLTIANASRLEEAIRNADARAAERIVVDLSQVTFMEHQVLVLLLRAGSSWLNDGNERLRFLPPDSEEVRHYIWSTGTSEMLFSE